MLRADGSAQSLQHFLLRMAGSKPAIGLIVFLMRATISKMLRPTWLIGFKALGPSTE
jgi:hypothetical protein